MKRIQIFIVSFFFTVSLGCFSSISGKQYPDDLDAATIYAEVLTNIMSWD